MLLIGRLCREGSDARNHRVGPAKCCAANHSGVFWAWRHSGCYRKYSNVKKYAIVEPLTSGKPRESLTLLDTPLDNVNLNINESISTPDDRPPLFSNTKGMASQEGFHCIHIHLAFIADVLLPYKTGDQTIGIAISHRGWGAIISGNMQQRNDEFLHSMIMMFKKYLSIT